MPKPARLWLLATVLACASLLTGCGKKTYPVEGQVVFEDGAPAKELAGYMVMFQPADQSVGTNGVIGANGEFTVGTFQDGDGAVLGKQRVAITPPIPMVDGPRPPELILAKYKTFETSNLEVEIKAETNRVTIKVERIKADNE